jgi:hypothetical protein
MKTKDEIMREARAHVAAFHAGSLEPDVEVETRQVNLPPLEVEDRRARSLRFHAEREADREQAIRERRDEERKSSEQRARASADWNSWVEQKINEVGFNERQTDIIVRTIGGVISELRKQLRDETKAAVDALRAELTNAKAHESGKILDLPNPLRRKSDAA